jgi:hypothetical protein
MFKALAGSMSLSSLNMISTIYYFNILLLTFFGAYVISEGLGDNPVLDGVTDETKQIGYYFVIYSILAFSAAAIGVMKLLIGKKTSAFVHKKFFQKSIVAPMGRKDGQMRGWLYFLTGVCFLSAVYVTTINGGAPQILLLSLEDQVGSLVARVSFEREFPGIIYIKTIFFEQVTIFLSLVSYCYYLMSRSRKDYFWFLFTFFLSIYSVTFSLSKSQLVVYLSYFIFIRIYSEGPLPMKYISIVLGGLMSILVFLFVVVTKMDSEMILIYMLNRLFIDQISGAYLMLEIFPSNYSHVGLCSLTNLIPSSVCASTEPATRLAMQHAFPVGSDQGVMNLLSTYYIGEAWANFGYFGLIVAPIYVGGLIACFYFIILQMRKTPCTIALLAFVSFGTNFSSHFNGYLYNMLFLATMVIVMLPLVIRSFVRVLSRVSQRTIVLSPSGIL